MESAYRRNPSNKQILRGDVVVEEEEDDDDDGGRDDVGFDWGSSKNAPPPPGFTHSLTVAFSSAMVSLETGHSPTEF